MWMTTATEDGRSLRVLSVDAQSGRLLQDVEVFRQQSPAAIHEKNSHATPTPVVAGEKVFVHFGAAGTACLRASDAGVVWKTQLPYEHGHGPGGSPVLFEDLLIVNCDGTDQQSVVALDAATGKQRWKSPRPSAMAYATSLVIDVGGQPQLVSPGAFRTVAYEPRTGKEVWSVRYGEGFSNVPRPVYGHGLVFLCTGFYGPNLLAVRPDGRGDITSSHVAWQTNRNVPYTPSPIIVGDEIYMVSDTGIATALDVRTGKQHWQQRLGGSHSASPVFADGRLYFLSEDGEATVLQPGTTFRKLATNTLEGRFLASIAVSNGALFLRSDSHLYKIGAPAR
jgi:outer membrane protein assembly factor BamB